MRASLPTDGLSRCVCATGGTPKTPAAIIGVAAGLVRLPGLEPGALRVGVLSSLHNSVKNGSFLVILRVLCAIFALFVSILAVIL